MGAGLFCGACSERTGGNGLRLRVEGQNQDQKMLSLFRCSGSRKVVESPCLEVFRITWLWVMWFRD